MKSKKQDQLEDTVSSVEVQPTALDTKKKAFSLPKKKVNIMPMSIDFSVVDKNNKYDKLSPAFSKKVDEVDRINKALIMNGYAGAGMNLAWPIDNYNEFHNPFSEDELEFLQKRLRHEFDFTDPNDKYLSTSNLILEYNEIKTLDLSKPHDFILYKLALMYSDLICRNIEETDYKKVAKWYLSEDEDVNMIHNRYIEQETKSMELVANLTNNPNKMYCFLSLVDRASYTKDNLIALKKAVLDYRTRQTEKFIDTLEDPLYISKVILALGKKSHLLKPYGSTGVEFISDKSNIALGDNERAVIQYLNEAKNGLVLQEIIEAIETKLKIEIK